MTKTVKLVNLFPAPVMSIMLDLDLEKLTELAFQLRDQDPVGLSRSNKGGWHSNDNINCYIQHEEFIKLEKEIIQQLQIYQSEIFRGIKFNKKVKHNIINMWITVNEKYSYNDLHDHPRSVLSGVYYIKHDGTREQGVITFKHPNRYIQLDYWNQSLLARDNEFNSLYVDFVPEPNKLLIFPSWLEHRVEQNLKDDTRISLSFNSNLK